MTNIPQDWKLGKIQKSVLPDIFSEKFELTELDEVEEYLNGVKGQNNNLPFGRA